MVFFSFYKLLLHQGIHFLSKPQRYCKKKEYIYPTRAQYPAMDYGHQMSVLSRLRGSLHRHIVAQLWALEYQDMERVQVAAAFVPGRHFTNCGMHSE